MTESEWEGNVLFAVLCSLQWKRVAKGNTGPVDQRGGAGCAS